MLENKMNTKKIIVIGSIVIVLGLAGYLIYSELAPKKLPAPQPAPRSGEQIDLGTIQITEDPNDVVRLYRTADKEVILTNKDKRTLYLFAKDADGVSNCFDTCAENWPPLVISPLDSLQVGSGVPKGVISTIKRGDLLQVTYKNRPLYLYKNDQAAGDMKGGSVANWTVVKP